MSIGVGITDLAHSLRKNTANSAVPIALSQGQQLVCAALGHKTLASFQAAQKAELEPQSFDGLFHVVPDFDLLSVRAEELGVAVARDRLEALLVTAFRERVPDTQVHRSFDALADDFYQEAQQAVLNDDNVSSDMGNANYDGVDEVYIEEDLKPHLQEVAQPEPVKVSGQVTLGIDIERPYSGHKVKFELEVTMYRCGRRCFERPEFDVVSSGLDYDWGDHDDAGPGPGARTLAQEFAERLGIEVEEAQQLVDAEPEELTSHTGEITSGYRYDFTDHASPELASKLIAMHGSLQLTVEPWIQEDLSHGANAPDL